MQGMSLSFQMAARMPITGSNATVVAVSTVRLPTIYRRCPPSCDANHYSQMRTHSSAPAPSQGGRPVVAVVPAPKELIELCAAPSPFRSGQATSGTIPSHRSPSTHTATPLPAGRATRTTRDTTSPRTRSGSRRAQPTRRRSRAPQRERSRSSTPRAING